jgi:hypothetical protein
LFNHIPGQSVRKAKNAQPLKMGEIGSPETSVNGYQYALRNIPEDRRPQPHLDRRLEGRKIIKLASEFGDSITESFI